MNVSPGPTGDLSRTGRGEQQAFKGGPTNDAEMRGTRWVILGLLSAILASAVLPWTAPSVSAAPIGVSVSPSGTPATPSAAVAPRLAGWHPVYTENGRASALALDSPRGRILLTATFMVNVNYTNGTPNYRQGYNLLVLNTSGGLQRNISLPFGVFWGGPKSIALDPATGDAYVTGYNFTTGNGTIADVDPGTGSILHVWSYGMPLDILVYGGGYIVSASGSGSYPLVVVDAANGVVVGNLSAYINQWADLVMDPSGTHVYAFTYGLVGSGYADVYKFTLPESYGTDLGIAGGSGAVSADGTRLYVCGGVLYTYWFSNSTITTGPACSGTGMRTNPVTDVLALATSGLLVDANGTDGSFHIWDLDPTNGYTWQALDAAWTADGTELLAINGSISPIQIGTWDGASWLGGPQGILVNPHGDPICFPIVTAEGVQGNTVTLYRDGYVLGPGAPEMTSACFGNMTNTLLPLPDGVHTGRITGLDKIGQPFDATVTFQTDGTPPVIDILSPLTTGVSPYQLRGTLVESHPSLVTVDYHAVPLSGANFTFTFDLVIGNTSAHIWANDTLGNWATRDLVIRYWPSLLTNVTNAVEHFQISVPPGWNGTLSPPSSTGAVTANLTAPGGWPYATAAVRAIRATLTEDQATAYAYALQYWNASPLPSQQPLPVITNLTVAGHPAAQFSYDLSVNRTYVHRLETFVVSGAWQRVYAIVIDVPYYAPAYGQTSDWILQSFVVAPGGVPPSGGTPPAAGTEFPWVLIGGAAAAVAAVAVAILLLWRRGRGPHP